MRVTLLSTEVQGRIDNKWWQLPRASRLLAQCDVAFDPKMWIPEKVFLLRVTQIKEGLTEIHITYRYIDDPTRPNFENCLLSSDGKIME